MRSGAAAAAVISDSSTITAKSIALIIMSTHSCLWNSFGFADNNGSGCDGNQLSRGVHWVRSMSLLPAIERRRPAIEATVHNIAAREKPQERFIVHPALDLVRRS